MPFYDEQEMRNVIYEAERCLLFNAEGKEVDFIVQRLREIRLQIEAGKVFCHR